jgi:hypothetical protein
MDDQKPDQTGGNTPRSNVPKSNEQAIVRCKDFRCLAYKDNNGIWHSTVDDAILEVLEVVTRF